jgi:hypothetical protein
MKFKRLKDGKVADVRTQQNINNLRKSSLWVELGDNGEPIGGETTQAGTIVPEKTKGPSGGGEKNEAALRNNK